MATHAHTINDRGPAATLAPKATAAVLEPDAVLVGLCREYLAAFDAYDRNGGHMDHEDDPLWLCVTRLEDKVAAIEPTTMAGVVALAQVAAHWARQPDGQEDFDTGFTGDWPQRVTRAVLRIAGGRA